METAGTAEVRIPWFGVRKFARSLLTELQKTRTKYLEARAELERIGAFTLIELEKRRHALQEAIEVQSQRLAQERATAAKLESDEKCRLLEMRQSLVAAEDLAVLQEAGIY